MRPLFIILLTIGVGGLATFGMVKLYKHMTHHSPVLTGHLSVHELHVPSDSALLPGILAPKLSRDAFGYWVNVPEREKQTAHKVLDEVEQYLKTYVLWDLSNDPLFYYTHYYRLNIENDSLKTFGKVFVMFPEIRSVEVRRSGMEGEILVPVGNRYFIGDVNPGETVTVYGWSDRPFYVQEENGVTLGHDGGLSEVLHQKTVEPGSPWRKQNLFLMAIFIVLILLLVHRMTLTIYSCIQSLDPKLEDKTTI